MRELFLIRLESLPVLSLLGVVGLLAWALARRSRRVPPRLLAPVQRSLETDLVYTLLSPVVSMASCALTTLGIAVCALSMRKQLGPELLRGFGPLARQPRPLMIAEMLLLSDLVYYFTHRLAHSVPALWRLHAVHHSTRRLRAVSAFRAHPLEIYVHLVNALPLFLLGFPVDALSVLAPITMLYALWIHSDSALSLRRLGLVVNTPMFHGWHHALHVPGGVKNFAGFFPFFDALFGTYALPPCRPAAVGVDPSPPDTYVAQLAHPFRAARDAAAPAALGGSGRSWGRAEHPRESWG
jgi:sterol desaturase/sphingolipid hydroxylase (fatty acid hydroxylase superfamily)